jgi:protein TonB
VKRLLLCIILAIGFHAIFLSTDLSWLGLAPQPALKSKSIAIVLTTVKSQKPGPEDAAFKEKQPEPHIYRKPEKNPDSAQIPAPVKPKKDLKALTLKKETLTAVETSHFTSIDKLDFPTKAEAKIGLPSDSSASPAERPMSTDSTLIKKTPSVPGGFSEPLTTATALPAAQAQEAFSVPPGINIARPLYRQNPPPDYPQRARRMGYEGLVMLQVLVDVNGRVENLELVSSSGYAVLDKAAIASVKKWMFEPGTEGGKKKKMWVKIPIRFELE